MTEINKDMLKKETHQDTIYYNTKDKESVDTKANYLASCLLMPELLFRNKHNETNGDIYKMAEIFKVSVLAIQIRYSQLGIDCPEW